MNLKQAYEIIKNDDNVKLDNSSPGYYKSHYVGETPNNILNAIELINCDIANNFTNWHCQCGFIDCEWNKYHSIK